MSYYLWCGKRIGSNVYTSSRKALARAHTQARKRKAMVYVMCLEDKGTHLAESVYCEVKP